MKLSIAAVNKHIKFLIDEFKFRFPTLRQLIGMGLVKSGGS
jgi:hypothetical protein